MQLRASYTTSEHFRMEELEHCYLLGVNMLNAIKRQVLNPKLIIHIAKRER